MFESIKEIILEFSEPDFEITPETRLKTDLGLTSFDLVCIEDRISSLTNQHFSDRQMRVCVTVGDLCVLGEGKVC